jgi:hypothetical protein
MRRISSSQFRFVFIDGNSALTVARSPLWAIGGQWLNFKSGKNRMARADGALQ